MSRFDAGLLARAAAFLGAREAEPLPRPQEEDAIALAAFLARRFEGFYSRPYLCPAGVPTIGYGATRYLDGRRVQLTDPPISKEAAERLLLRQLEREFGPSVDRLCPGLSGRRKAAIIDFTFNLGAGNLQASTLRRKINAGLWDEVPDQLRRWNRSGGVVLAGLTRRREAEAGLI